MSRSVLKDELINQLDRVEFDRKNLCSDLDSLTISQLQFQKGAEKWNILQILDHVMTSEKLTVLYIKRKTGSAENIVNSGFRSKFRIFALKLAFILPFKYKAPKMSDSTGKNPNYEDLKSEWQEVRDNLKELIQKMDESTLKSEIFKHPIVGMLNMKQTLEFFEIHFNHHRKQINDLKDHPSFPA